MKKTKKKLTKKHIIIITIILVIIIGLLITSYFVFFKKDKNVEHKEEKIVEVKKLQIIDEDSNARPIAVMIPNDNYGGDQSQYNLQKAYMVYEIEAEASITRLMAVFKDKDIDKIGPVRSSRDYYIDYALENDAIYVAYGWSPQAQQDLSKNHVTDYLNGMVHSIFERDENYASPNNAYTSTKAILDKSTSLGYRLTSDNYKILNYSTDEVSYISDETYQNVNKISIKSFRTASYVYDSENNYYVRYHGKNAQIDQATNEAIHTKNVIILEIPQKVISGDEKGRIDLQNIGSGKGYYLTNGGMIDITWSKESRSDKTKYTLSSGEELVVNDGNTWVTITPNFSNVSYE